MLTLNLEYTVIAANQSRIALHQFLNSYKHIQGLVAVAARVLSLVIILATAFIVNHCYQRLAAAACEILIIEKHGLQQVSKRTQALPYSSSYSLKSQRCYIQHQSISYKRVRVDYSANPAANPALELRCNLHLRNEGSSQFPSPQNVLFLPRSYWPRPSPRWSVPATSAFVFRLFCVSDKPFYFMHTGLNIDTVLTRSLLFGSKLADHKTAY